eukprot:SAG11_NODE_100_length_16863_cov_12.374911_16_plen_103_part_00
MTIDIRPCVGTQFAIGAIARLAVLPLAVLALVDTKKPVAETKYLRALFHALLAVAVIQILDVGLCIFEVNIRAIFSAVCSPSLIAARGSRAVVPAGELSLRK